VIKTLVDGRSFSRWTRR